MREYGVDPLEALFVREVMTTEIVTARPDTPAARLRTLLIEDPLVRRQRLYPVVDEDENLVGVVGWTQLVNAAEGAEVEAIMVRDVVFARPDEVLRTVASRMAEHKLGAMPVVEHGHGAPVLGIVTEFELLAGRRRQLEEERKRERPFRLSSRTLVGRTS